MIHPSVIFRVLISTDWSLPSGGREGNVPCAVMQRTADGVLSPNGWEGPLLYAENQMVAVFVQGCATEEGTWTCGGGS